MVACQISYIIFVKKQQKEKSGRKKRESEPERQSNDISKETKIAPSTDAEVRLRDAIISHALF